MLMCERCRKRIAVMIVTPWAKEEPAAVMCGDCYRGGRREGRFSVDQLDSRGIQAAFREAEREMVDAIREHEDGLRSLGMLPEHDG